MKRRAQGKPNTKRNNAQEEPSPRRTLAQTRRVSQFQQAETRSVEPTACRRPGSTVRPRSQSHPPNNGLVSKERHFNEVVVSRDT